MASRPAWTRRSGRRPLVVGLDPVMIALLTFWCTVLVRMAMHP